MEVHHDLRGKEVLNFNEQELAYICQGLSTLANNMIRERDYLRSMNDSPGLSLVGYSELGAQHDEVVALRNNIINLS